MIDKKKLVNCQDTHIYKDHNLSIGCSMMFNSRLNFINFTNISNNTNIQFKGDLNF